MGETDTLFVSKINIFLSLKPHWHKIVNIESLGGRENVISQK